MDDVGWSVLGIVLLTGGSLFYSLNNFALRSFSFVKLQEAFKAADKETCLDAFVEKTEKFIVTCSLLGLIANIGIFVVLAGLLTARGIGFVPIFFIAVFGFIVVGFAVPYSWAKYAGESVLARTRIVLEVSARLTISLAMA